MNRYCHSCEFSFDTKYVLPLLIKQVFCGIVVKRRKIDHLEIDDGCGRSWYTHEIPEDVLIESG